MCVVLKPLCPQVGAPSDIQQYIHRLGRTGRAGKGGEGVLVLAPWENYFLQNFQKLPVTELMPPKVEPQNTEKVIPDGF
jgi:ATP-dependent RNA helicase MSS116